ncbi:MAG: hypothetical protein LBC96_10205 [Lachnospiraceae bacterium]|nr:hypothetical protein [Lachnospiraceae bacterium]
MKILSAVSWSNNDDGNNNRVNRTSLLLRHTDCRRGSLLVAMLCHGGQNDGGMGIEDPMLIATGYLVEQVKLWYEHNYLQIIYRNKPLSYIKNSLCSLLRVTEQDLWEYLLHENTRREQCELGIGFSIMIIWRRKYITLQSGEAKIRLFKSRPRNSFVDRLSQLSSSKRSRLLTMRKKKVKRGRHILTPNIIHKGSLRRGVGFLISDSGFGKRLSLNKLEEALNPVELRSESQISKRLAAIAAVSNDNTAIYLKGR